MFDVLTLIHTDNTVNAQGDVIQTETPRVVFCEVKSVGLKRKLQAMSAGLKLAYKFVLTCYADYNGEEIVEFNGKRYNVIDTYVNGDGIEISAAEF